MPLHPDDVVRKTFRTTQFRKGYDDQEVDAFLEEVVGELRRLRAESDEQRGQIDRLEQMARTGESARLTVERQQLHQIRLERDAVMQELRDLDRRLEKARADARQFKVDL
ncbi:DivIVA domain-containing protein [Ornithinimicrobium cerasi]|uniref:DivIVA domain-containing protein n=1 Tax=Ornithinimicrobium cerasi TaxID=2248773 RepID=UPI000BE29A62|nr:DivIVA domain-containing protein [Ornithinimicrobium cerasi]